jgi:hypothetical protein
MIQPLMHQRTAGLAHLRRMASAVVSSFLPPYR